MKIALFDPPGKIADLGTPALKAEFSKWLSDRFDVSVTSVTKFLTANGGGACQFYNPLTHGRTDPDLPATSGDIPWNGFPKRFLSTGPGAPTKFADAEPKPRTGKVRPQDEYLEWFVHRDAAQKITRIDFTCEGYDYFEFLANHAPDVLLAHYRTFIDPAVQQAELFKNGKYDVTNKWNTERGAMHLTHPANNLFAEVFLAASATVRRRKAGGGEEASSIPLIRCGEYGDERRNSDPNIGAAVNGLARDKRAITLANPVGLYMSSFDGAGLTLDGAPAGGFFKVLRGALPFALRAVFELPAALAAAGKTVSDVKIGAKPIEFGGQLAQRVTMHLLGVASVAQTIDNVPAVCGEVLQSRAPIAGLGAAPAPVLVSRKAQ